MAKYIVLVNWTDQGIKNVKESPQRLDAAKALAKSLGCEIRKMYLTIGSYDMVCIVEAPTDEAMTKLGLSLGRNGSIRTTTLKAFSEPSYRKIIGELP